MNNDDELRAAARHCKPGCPGPSALEIATGGHSCDSVRAITMLATRDELERARNTAVELEQQLARVRELAVELITPIAPPELETSVRKLLSVIDGDEADAMRALHELSRAEL